MYQYERTFPTWNDTIDFAAAQTNNLYVDPKYPVHIIAGSAGCREFFDNFDKVFYGPYSAFRSATYGYGRMAFHNATHMHWEQLIDEGQAGMDELWLVKKARTQQTENAPTRKNKELADQGSNSLIADM